VRVIEWRGEVGWVRRRGRRRRGGGEGEKRGGREC
jgi:hypothetical protein